MPRQYDRHQSGTGRRGSEKRGGKGQYNWGAEMNDYDYDAEWAETGAPRADPAGALYNNGAAEPQATAAIE
eukprot:CAMPEP_0182454912 /NCGR_PEP_ID=MMETSP1319-20130603/1329_1 /TAXON_ID=172717 /ORGANISM="Bolidomonas pacifica, Strain RCC208" /LENGTH=70 /DNA_ID=CAMNT_0024652941 /DNA_START=15 /DNA_END=227 /DNA_ORIENTATION=+